MTSDGSPLPELPPSEQPPTDDPWVIVTPAERHDEVNAQKPTRRRAYCAVCGAYWACEHDQPS